LLFLYSCSNARAAEQVNVAAASDLNFAIKEIIQQFEPETGHKVVLTLGSSFNHKDIGRQTGEAQPNGRA
jgi:ABC-type molybdate transport system substrate-binding protein